jgi:hypothetical protein
LSAARGTGQINGSAADALFCSRLRYSESIDDGIELLKAALRYPIEPWAAIANLNAREPIFRAMSTTIHEPIFKPIDFEVDIEMCTARVSIPTLLESTGRPILIPATGEQHRVRIDIPNGIEFEIAEIGSESTKATGTIGLDLNDSYGQFNIVRPSGTGVVHTRP